MIVVKKENGGLRIQAEGGCFRNVNTVIALSGDMVKCDELGKTVFDARSIANHCKNYYVNNSGGFLANALADMTASIFDKHKECKWDVTYVIFEMKDGTPWFTKIHVYNEWGINYPRLKTDFPLLPTYNVCGELVRARFRCIAI